MSAAARSPEPERLAVGTPTGRGGAAASRRRLGALVRKEFVQIRRDRRTLALIVLVPVMLMIIFGYAASFDVHHLSTELVGHDDPLARSVLSRDGTFDFRPGVARDLRAARNDIQHGRAVVAIEISATGVPDRVLVDGSRLLEAMTAQRHLSQIKSQVTGSAHNAAVEVLYNPSLRSASFMVPGLVGQIMVQVALVLTAVGIVRERERGTIEQLMITPLSKVELMVGKTVPYLLIALVDLAVVVLLGWGLFGVPMRGSVVLLVVLSGLFLIATLGMGLLISTAARTQQQAMQLAVFVQLPQMLLSGLIFPLSSMPWGVRWLGYVLPLTYYVPITRGIMLKGAGPGDLWPQAAVLVLMSVVFVGAAAIRFRKSLD